MKLQPQQYFYQTSRIIQFNGLHPLLYIAKHMIERNYKATTRLIATTEEETKLPVRIEFKYIKTRIQLRSAIHFHIDFWF